MDKKKIFKFFFSFVILLLLSTFFYLKYLKNEKNEKTEKENEDIIYNSNIIKNVEYSTRDKDGNEYLINADEGNRFSNSNIIFLKQVYALVKLNNSEEVIINSDYGKYNSENYDTIFSKNVIIKYLNNKITGEYLDFSQKTQ